MKDIYLYHTYSIYLVVRIEKEIFPCYDLWSLRSYQNRKFEYISGNCNENEKFSQFITTHAEREHPSELLLVFGNGEKKYPNIMVNTRKKYMIIRFNGRTEYLGEPLIYPQYLSKNPRSL